MQLWKGDRDMWKKKEKPVVDERIEKESNRLSAKMFYVLTILTAILLAVKIAKGLPIVVYLLEIVTLLAGIIYYGVTEVKSGIFLAKERDEVLMVMHEKNLAPPGRQSSSSAQRPDLAELLARGCSALGEPCPDLPHS